MRKPQEFWLSFASIFLFFLGIVGFSYRKDNDRVQSLPAIVTGLGLMSSSVIGRNLRRKKLLVEIHRKKKI